MRAIRAISTAWLFVVAAIIFAATMGPDLSPHRTVLIQTTHP